jgi:hypothetical protein
MLEVIENNYAEDCEVDRLRYKNGNCFKTEAEAQAAAEKVKALLRSLQDNGNNLVSNSPDKQLPDWVEIGGYVYDARNGYGKIVSGSVKSCYIEFDGGAGDFVPEAFRELKQARLRPYNAEEMKALVGKPITLLDGTVCLCTAYSKRDNSVILDSIHWDAQELLGSGYTIDNKPCGKLEHLEAEEWVE